MQFKILFVTVLILVISVPATFARMWTDSTGKHIAEAEFVDIKNGKVHLKREDGEPIVIPIRKLSKADQQFVKVQSQTKRDLEIERMLLTTPDNADQRRAYEEEWKSRVGLKVAFLLGRSPADRMRGSPGLEATLIGLEVTNHSPCPIDLISVDKFVDRLSGLRVMGAKRESGMSVLPNGKLLLATQKRIPLVSLPYGQAGCVDSLSTGVLCGINVHPKNTTMKNLKLSILYCCGTLGPRIVFCDYTVCLAGEEEKARDAMLHH